MHLELATIHRRTLLTLSEIQTLSIGHILPNLKDTRSNHLEQPVAPILLALPRLSLLIRNEREYQPDRFILGIFPTIRRRIQA